MSDIFREVDEDVRRDRLQALWKRYGTYLIAALVLIVLGTAGVTYWRHYQAQQRIDYADRFYAAVKLLEEDQTPAASEAFQTLAEDAGGGYGLVSRLRLAGLQAKDGDSAGAIATYDAIVNDSGLDKVYRDLAQVLASLQILKSGGDDLPAWLQTLSGENNVWRHLAREIQALDDFRNGNKEAAIEAFRALATEPAAAAGSRARAQEMLRVLGVELSADEPS